MRVSNGATLLGIVAGLLSGCGSDAAAPAAGDVSATSTPAADADSNELATVEHAMGTTHVACTPVRVVTLGQGQTDSTLALGVTPVGVVEPWTDEFYAYLPDEVHDAQVVGTELEPDLEAIAALEPDVILGSKLRHETIYEQLSRIAPTVFAETIGRTWKDNVSLWAQALCREQEGEQVLGAWEERTADFERDLGELADTEVSLIRFMPDQVRIYLTGFPGSVLRDAGLDRPEAQQVEDWETSEQLIGISQERIPDMDGDVMFVMLSDWTEGEAVQLQEQWTSHPLWRRLRAVENHAVFPVNEEHWNLGGGILAANAMLDDLAQHFLEPGGVRAALTGDRPSGAETATGNGG
ncbi:MAG: iron-siderophore ABC transporter substrate-binding protein [Actinobacteria bacterium]|nr:iron-siderophore ABC transporter substrate-binding protein [Actinomycetota bacterium]